MNEVNEKAERAYQYFLEDLMDVGEQCVNHARKLPSMSRANPLAKYPHQPNYIDDSGNLRSSIGYVVVEDGRIIGESAFEAVGNGAEGSATGRSFAESLVATHPNDTALILVAGMHYAEYVAAKGYDVLDSATLLAEQLINDLTNTYNQELS